MTGANPSDDNHDDSTEENGQTRTGKTTPLSHFFWSSGGFLYCDPKGEDIDELLELTDERQDEIVWVDNPEDEDRDGESRERRVECAEGDGLTNIGELYGVSRIPGEDDDSYRKRVIDAHQVVIELSTEDEQETDYE